MPPTANLKVTINTVRFWQDCLVQLRANRESESATSYAEARDRILRIISQLRAKANV